MPAAEPVHDKVEDPDPPVIVVEDSVHESLVELVVKVRATVPAKPFRGAIFTVEMLSAPTLAVSPAGLAEMAKSGDDDGDTETYTLVE